MAQHLALSSAAAVLGCGMYGYLRAGSAASLAGGAALCCAFAVSGLAIQKTDHIGFASIAAAASGAACTAIGARRWCRVRMQQQQGASRKVAPLLLLTIGVTNVAYYSMKAWEFRENL
ncbi:hypothetical protein, conserved [Eimeria tenella]|uniref:Transmembrane protein 14C n=1 Tax=Eimeria tenella TaxID=5802 RepID=U6KQU3_EIMTE|nr:hypothetical protein, conserved [Eimeria tenella]CDJ38739.1 hypothetical protein, conserved [Eimeria tenella]|eukprot:XP_013229495.1 hypothetical protein, conserved [Eimeria tenella]